MLQKNFAWYQFLINKKKKKEKMSKLWVQS